MLRTDLRVARLAVFTCLRASGLAPWAIAVGWMGIAAAQEPRMLRTFGVNLTLQGAWVAAAVLLVILAARAPITRRVVPYLISLSALTIACATLLAAGVALLELLRGAPVLPGSLAGHWGAFVFTFVPVAVAASLAGIFRDWVTSLFLTVMALVAATQAVQLDRGVWSWPHLVGSMAGFGAAAAMAQIHGRKTI